MKRFFRFIKENYKTIGSVLVVVALIAACTATILGKKMSKRTVYGKMISINPLYEDEPLAPHYSKISYASLGIDGIVSDGTLGENVGAYSADKVLTEQQQKDKLALEELLASNDGVDTVTAKAAAQDRRKKYKLNELGDTNASANVTITPRATASAGNSGVGTAQYASGGSYLGRFLLTGYCPCVICCGKTNGITASGALATSNHTIAADRRYAFGTKMVIFGQVYTVEDRGGAINGNHIDIFFNTHEEALQFGKRYGDVYLYTGEDNTTANNSNSGSSDNSGTNTSSGGSGSITLIGDSLTVGATNAFKTIAPDANIDGVVGRQMTAGINVVNDMKNNGTLGDTVIIELGTNGVFSTESGQALIDAIGSDKRIFWVNTYGPGLSWYTDVNAVISALAAANPNVTEVDWASVGLAHPEYFASDGIHMTSAGYAAFAQLMYDATQ